MKAPRPIIYTRSVLIGEKVFIIERSTLLSYGTVEKLYDDFSVSWSIALLKGSNGTLFTLHWLTHEYSPGRREVLKEVDTVKAREIFQSAKYCYETTKEIGIAEA